MIDARYASNPQDFASYNTDTLRQQFLVAEIFSPDEINCTYSHYDRYIVGGAQPIAGPLSLKTFPDLKSNFFLERREMGIINVGADSRITVDGSRYDLKYKEALYIGRGAQEVHFHPAADGNALFYFNSAPAHATYPTRIVTHADAETVELGSMETSNHRTIRKLIVNSVVPTCQLQMGLTELKKGSVWNTMPAHTHDRRMEAYFYFELADDQAVCHFMGKPQETRHLWVKNRQAIISPPWSIHSGVGTSNYSFIWGMAGENLDYSDMDIVQPADLR